MHATDGTGAHTLAGAWPGRRLLGRRAECEVLDRLLTSARAGQSRVLVLRGEAGVGKTALLEYLLEHASGCRIARAAGTESATELAFAGLHQLCAPFLDRIECLPGPQRAALATAFGLRDGDAPGRFAVGLAVLSLLADVAREQPLVCAVDDAQWLDRASAQALSFVARRLAAEAVAVVFSLRQPAAEQGIAGLVELVVHRLPDSEAQALLVGTERLQSSGYFRAKLAQEEALKAAPVPYTILRATQFFEFIGPIADFGTQEGTVLLPPVLFQPESARDVAVALAEIAEGAPVNGTVELGGPERFRLDELVRRFLSATDDPRKVVTDAHAPYFGIEVDERALIPADGSRVGATRFADWLRQSAGQVAS